MDTPSTTTTTSTLSEKPVITIPDFQVIVPSQPGRRPGPFAKVNKYTLYKVHFKDTVLDRRFNEFSHIRGFLENKDMVFYSSAPAFPPRQFLKSTNRSVIKCRQQLFEKWINWVYENFPDEPVVIDFLTKKQTGFKQKGIAGRAIDATKRKKAASKLDEEREKAEREYKRKAKALAERKRKDKIIAEATEAFLTPYLSENGSFTCEGIEYQWNGKTSEFSCSSGVLSGKGILKANESVGCLALQLGSYYVQIGKFNEKSVLGSCLLGNVDEGELLLLKKVDNQMKWTQSENPEFEILDGQLKSQTHKSFPIQGKVPPPCIFLVSTLELLQKEAVEARKHRRAQFIRDGVKEAYLERFRNKLTSKARTSCSGCSSSGANMYICPHCFSSHCTNCTEGGVNRCRSCNKLDAFTVGSIWMWTPGAMIDIRKDTISSLVLNFEGESINVSRADLEARW